MINRNKFKILMGVCTIFFTSAVSAMTCPQSPIECNSPTDVKSCLYFADKGSWVGHYVDYGRPVMPGLFYFSVVGGGEQGVVCWYNNSNGDAVTFTNNTLSPNPDAKPNSWGPGSPSEGYVCQSNSVAACPLKPN
jgi:hypothetical protein